MRYFILRIKIGCKTRLQSTQRLIHKDSSGADCFISTFGGLRYYMKEKGFETFN